MRIQSIGIFANPNNEGALAAVSSVYGVARSRGIKCFIDRTFANMEEFSGYETIQEQVPGLMIAIGGDGTRGRIRRRARHTHTWHKLWPHRIPERDRCRGHIRRAGRYRERAVPHG